MNTSTLNPLDGLAAELVGRGLPVDYAQRAASEIADHHRDLVSELRSTGLDETAAAAEASRRLGESRTLTKKTVREYQRRFWCGRWPLLTFFIGPIPLVILTWVATWIAVFCFVWPLQKLAIIGNYQPDGVLSTWERLVCLGGQAWFLLATPALALLILSQLAARAALGRSWVVLTAGILAMFSGLFLCEFAGNCFRFTLPADQGLLMVGFPFVRFWLGTRNWGTLAPYIAQVLLPLGIATVILLRNRQLSLRARQLVLDDC